MLQVSGSGRCVVSCNSSFMTSAFETTRHDSLRNLSFILHSTVIVYWRAELSSAIFGPGTGEEKWEQKTLTVGMGWEYRP